MCVFCAARIARDGECSELPATLPCSRPIASYFLFCRSGRCLTFDFTCIIASKQTNSPTCSRMQALGSIGCLADCSLQLATARRMIMHEGVQLTGKERHRPRLPETQRGKHQTSKGKKTLSRKPTLLDTANPGGPSSRPIETNKQMMSRRLPALSAPTLKHPLLPTADCITSTCAVKDLSTRPCLDCNVACPPSTHVEKKQRRFLGIGGDGCRISFRACDCLVRQGSLWPATLCHGTPSSAKSTAIVHVWPSP